MSANRCENPLCKNDEASAAVAHCDDCHNFLCALCLDGCERISVKRDSEENSLMRFNVPICGFCVKKRLVATKQAEIKELVYILNVNDEELFQTFQKMSHLEEKHYKLEQHIKDCEKTIADYRYMLVRTRAELAEILE